jgi:hypothetical protein
LKTAFRIEAYGWYDDGNGSSHHIHGQQFQLIKRHISGVNDSAYNTVKYGFIDNGW